MAQHTPGPFTYEVLSRDYDKHEPPGNDHVITDPDGYVLAEIIQNPEDGPLFAAAPDMYAALEAMLKSQDAEWENQNLGHDWEEACQQARAAIAKARGADEAT